MQDEKKFIVRSKIWIEDNKGNVAFGHGRVRMLKAIQQTGSMNAAAKQLKMSYRAVWGRIRQSEERIGKELVVKKGKGSLLTPFALEMMEQFELLESRISDQTDEIFSKLISNALAP